MSRLHRQTARARTCTHTHTHNHTRIHTHTHTHTHAHVPPRETRAHDTHAHRPLGLKQASTSLVPCVPALGEEDRGYETASAVRVRVEGRRRAEGIGSAGREMVRASSIDACMRMHSTHVPTVQGAHAQHLRWQMHGPVEAQGPRTRLVDGQEPCAARCHDVRPCCRPAHPVHPAPAMRSRESGISLRKRVGERGTGGGLRGKWQGGKGRRGREGRGGGRTRGRPRRIEEEKRHGRLQRGRLLRAHLQQRQQRQRLRAPHAAHRRLKCCGELTLPLSK